MASAEPSTHTAVRLRTEAGAAANATDALSRIEQLPDEVLGHIAAALIGLHKGADGPEAALQLLSVCKACVTFYRSQAINRQWPTEIIYDSVEELVTHHPLTPHHPGYRIATTACAVRHDEASLRALLASGDARVYSRFRQVHHVCCDESSVDADSIAAIMTLFPAATCLQLDCGCRGDALYALAACLRITDLSLHPGGLRAEIRDGLSRLTHLTRLSVVRDWEVLAHEGDDDLEDREVWDATPLAQLAGLRALELQETHNNSDARVRLLGLPAIARACSQLSHLRLEGFDGAEDVECGWPALHTASLHAVSYGFVAALHLHLAPSLAELGSAARPGTGAFYPNVGGSTAASMAAAFRSLAGVRLAARARMTCAMFVLPEDLDVHTWALLLRQLREACPNLRELGIRTDAPCLARGLVAAVATELPHLTRLGCHLRGGTADGHRIATNVLGPLLPPAMPELRVLDLSGSYWDRVIEEALLLLCAGVAARRPGTVCVVPDQSGVEQYREVVACFAPPGVDPARIVTASC